MSRWANWRSPDWNTRLLDHFFMPRHEGESNVPVTVLLVTSVELVRATGDLAASPDAVLKAFVDAVRRRLYASVEPRSLLADALEISQTWKQHRCEGVPPFLSHLLITCIAASESTEDLADERSFVKRLRELVGGQLPDNTLGFLPGLWRDLEVWLRSGNNPKRYRPLRLPDPGGLTRIGYSIKLTFPDRRDQQALADRLGSAGLLGREPPVGKVLSLLSGATVRAQFRGPFCEALDDFRQRFDRCDPADRASLLTHRFWAAVREAALRGRDRGSGSDTVARMQLLAEEQDNQLAVFVVADRDISATTHEVATQALPHDYGGWRFGVVDGQDAAGEAGLDVLARNLLLQRVRLPYLSGIVDGGMLPFVEAPHGLLELAASGSIEETQVVLLRRELTDDFVRLFGTRTTRCSVSSYEGWVAVRGARLRVLPRTQLEMTSLRDCWFVQEVLLPPMVRLRGGVRVDDGWLGYAEVLPEVVFDAASSVSLETPDGDTRSLTRSSEGTWNLPRDDYHDRHLLKASVGGRELDAKTIWFRNAPATEQYKSPTDAEAWLAEGLAGCIDPAGGELLRDIEPVADAESWAARTLYLGSDIGCFLESPIGAVWRVSRFAGRTVITRAPRSRSEVPAPRVQSACHRARRVWRTLVLRTAPDPSDPGGIEVLRDGRNKAMRRDLEKVATGNVPGTLDYDPRPCRPVPAVDRFVSIVASIASHRAGIPLGDWGRLLESTLGLGPGPHRDAVTRAWTECGYVDVASFARWRQRAVFLRRPTLAAYRVAEGYGATLSGLALPRTRLLAAGAAHGMGVEQEERYSFSPFVPPTLTFRAPDSRLLEGLARAAELPLRWLDLDFDALRQHRTRDSARAAPLNYFSLGPQTTWTLDPTASQSPVRFERWTRPDRPDYWTVTDGRRIRWSYEQNVARLWACALLGLDACEERGEHELLARRAYLPLPLARLAALLGPALPGPADGGEGMLIYRYAFVSSATRAATLRALRDAYVPFDDGSPRDEEELAPCSTPSAASYVSVNST